MQVKINFLCRDSILAAPLCLDLVLLIDAAARDGRYGTQAILEFLPQKALNTTIPWAKNQRIISIANTYISRMLSAKWVAILPMNS